MVKSLPWQGIVGGAGAGDDSGRYNAGEWWSVWGVQQRASGLIVPPGGTTLRTLVAWANIGVYYGVEDRLEVTDGGAFSVDVKTGAALVEGAFFYEDIVRTLDIPIADTYYIVVRKNYGNLPYSPPGYAAGDGIVPAYTTRITWVTVAGFDQDTTRADFWDIKLATVVVAVTGVVTVTDEREWVDAEIKNIFAPVLCGTGVGAGLLYITAPFGGPAITFVNADDTEGYARTVVPKDYLADMTIVGVCVSNGVAGNIYASLTWDAGTCSENYATHTGTAALAAEAFNANNGYYSCHRSISPAGISPNDFLRLTFRRNANNALDTVEHQIYFTGFYIEYLGWR